LAVLVDKMKPPGLLTSTRAEKVLTFLESCAGAPEGALALLFPFYRQALRIIRGSGYALRCWKPGEEVFWCPIVKPVPTDDTYMARCSLGWLAARLKECDGRLQGRDAVLKNGQRLTIHVVPPAPVSNHEPGLAVLLSKGIKPPDGWYYVSAQDLRNIRLLECVKKA